MPNKLAEIFKRPHTYLYLIVVFFLAQALYSLDLRVVMDEAWHSSISWNLTSTGILNSPVFKDSFDGVDKICVYPPIHLLMLSAIFKVFGLGIVQGRLLSVFFGFLSIILTYLLAKRLYGEMIAVFSAAVLASDNCFFLASRTIRGEVFVAFFVLLSVYLLINAIDKDKAWMFFLSGVAAGLGILSHMNALFGLIALFAIFFYAYGFRVFRKSYPFIFLCGLVLCLFPFFMYLLYVGHNYGFAYVQDQFQLKNRVLPLFSYAWLFESLRGEIARYSDFIYFPYRVHVFVLSLVAFAFAFMQRKKSEIILLAVILAFITSFYLFIVNKNVRYIADYLPFLAILITAAIFGIAKYLPRRVSLVSKERIAIGILALLIISQIVGNSLFFMQYANSGYTKFTGKIKVLIPVGSSVYATITYWVGLHDHSYYAHERGDFLKARSLYNTEIFITHDREMMIDDREASRNELIRMSNYLENNGVLLGVINNEFYGNIRVYRIDRSAKK